MIAVGITGTDTGVGKTVVSCAIAAAFARRGLRVAVMKPVETGVGESPDERDATLLRQAGGSGALIELIAPVTFGPPISPLAAARRTGEAIDLARLDAVFTTLAEGSDAMIVEGAGGLLVPITPEVSFDGLFRRWQLPIVVVAANRLGVLNHARLTVAAAAQASLPVRALVLKSQPITQVDASTYENAEVLRELLPGVPVLEFPWISDSRDWAGLASIAEESGLAKALINAA